MTDEEFAYFIVMIAEIVIRVKKCSDGSSDTFARMFVLDGRLPNDLERAKPAVGRAINSEVI